MKLAGQEIITIELQEVEDAAIISADPSTPPPPSNPPGPTPPPPAAPTTPQTPQENTSRTETTTPTSTGSQRPVTSSSPPNTMTGKIKGKNRNLIVARKLCVVLSRLIFLHII